MTKIGDFIKKLKAMAAYNKEIKEVLKRRGQYPQSLDHALVDRVLLESGQSQSTMNVGNRHLKVDKKTFVKKTAISNNDLFNIVETTPDLHLNKKELDEFIRNCELAQRDDIPNQKKGFFVTGINRVTAILALASPEIIAKYEQHLRASIHKSIKEVDESYAKSEITPAAVAKQKDKIARLNTLEGYLNFLARNANDYIEDQILSSL